MSDFNRFANPKENCGLAHDSTARARAVGTGSNLFFLAWAITEGVHPYWYQVGTWYLRSIKASGKPSARPK